MIIDEKRLGNAENAYVLANTPLYIVRRLKEDAFVIDLARHYGSADILSELKSRLHRQTVGEKDRVIPLVLLVALAIKQDVAALNEASTLDQPGNRWFRQVSSALLQQTSATQVSKLNLTQVDVAPPRIARISSVNQRVKLEAQQ